MHIGFWWGNLRKGDHLEYPGLDGRIILQWNFRALNGGAWTGFIWLRIGTGGGLCRHRKEPSGSIKCGESRN